MTHVCISRAKYCVWHELTPQYTCVDYTAVWNKDLYDRHSHRRLPRNHGMGWGYSFSSGSEKHILWKAFWSRPHYIVTWASTGIFARFQMQAIQSPQGKLQLGKRLNALPTHNKNVCNMPCVPPWAGNLFLAGMQSFRMYPDSTLPSPLSISAYLQN